MPNPRALTVAAFVAQAAIWGSSFTLIKLALVDLRPSAIVIARLVLGAAVLVLVALATRTSLRVCGRVWLHVAVSAVFANVIPYLLLTVAEGTVSAGLAGVLVGATPVLTLALGRLALREGGSSRQRALGFALAFAGVVVVSAPWSSPLGAGACFLAAASHAVVLLGALSTGTANVLYFRLVRELGAAGAAAVDYLVPVFAVLIGALTLGEAVPVTLLAGGVVILIGMVLAEQRLSHGATQRHTPHGGSDRTDPEPIRTDRTD